MIALACLVMALVIQMTQTTQTAPATPRERPLVSPAASVVRGRVLADTGAPVRKARVVIAEEGKDPQRDPAYTDLDGRFAFADVPPGRYVLSASKPGYVATRTGARQPLEPAAPVALGEMGGTLTIEIRLARAAAINGHVFDETGEPLMQASVAAARLVRSGTRVKLATIATATTDDLGEYRLAGLPAGSYIVTLDPAAASLSESQAMFIVDATGTVAMRGQSPQSWQRLYYPSTGALGQAQPLSVRGGQELSGIDFTATPRSLPQVAITVSDPTGARARGLLILESDSPLQPARRQLPFNVEGTLTTPLEPGDWDIFALGIPSGSAMSHITVADSDLAVALVLTRGARVAGRIVVDGAVTPQTARPTIQATFPWSPAGPFGGVSSTVGRDGSFVLEDIQGTFELRLRNAPPGWFIQSVSVGGRTLSDTSLKVAGTRDVSDVVVEISSRPSALSGTAVGASGAPSPGVSVLVFPKNTDLLRNPARWARWLKTDQHGRFAAGDLPAGEYYAIAVDDVDDTQWSMAEYLDRFRPHALAFALAAGERKTIDVTVWNAR